MGCCKCEEYKWPDPQEVVWKDEEGDGKEYCVYHAPRNQKTCDIQTFNNRVSSKIYASKLRSGISQFCNFGGTIFPGDISLSKILDDNSIPRCSFRDTTFHGFANFENIKFTGQTSFENALFECKANFYGTTFSAHTNYSSARFNNETRFTSSTFSEQCLFDNSTFIGKGFFTDAQFYGDAHFRGSTFSDRAGFCKTKFLKKAIFSETTFKKATHFEEALFYGNTEFNNATFENTISFNKSDFRNNTTFYESKFHNKTGFEQSKFSDEINFHNSTFQGNAYFGLAVFKNSVSFTMAKFNQTSYFPHTKFMGLANFAATRFKAGVVFDKCSFEGRCYFIKTAFSNKTRFSRVVFDSLSSFYGSSFNGTSIFTQCRFNNKSLFRNLLSIKDLRFYDINRDDFKWIDFLYTQVKNISFLNVSWNRHENQPRYSMYTDGMPSKYSPLAEFYRQMKKRSRDEQNDAEASLWHYAEKEVQLKLHRLEKPYSFQRYMLEIYRSISRYGEDPRQAGEVLFYLLVVLFSILAFGGFHHLGKPPFDITSERVSNLFLTFAQYALFIKPTWTPPPVYDVFALLFSRLLIPIQAAIFAFALRNKLHR